MNRCLKALYTSYIAEKRGRDVISLGWLMLSVTQSFPSRTVLSISWTSFLTEEFLQRLLSFKLKAEKYVSQPHETNRYGKHDHR